MASAEPPRVALLARSAELRGKVAEALRGAGADIVLSADPAESDPRQVSEASPQAILVLLDAGDDDGLARYQDLFADPGHMVIFEEADQVARREGWDAARWLRHLTAKLFRHGDVLPPGSEVDDHALHPVPGPLSAPHALPDFDEVIAGVTGEAQRHAGQVPSDSGFERPAAATDEPVEAPAATPFALSADGATPADGTAALEVDTLDLARDPADPGPFDPVAALDDGEALSAASESGIDWMPPSGLGETVEGIDEFLSARAPPHDDADAQSGDDFAVETAAMADDAVPAVPTGDGFRLSDEDDASAAAARAKPAAAFDFAALSGGLSLADPDSYGHGPVRGVVLVEAGLGGPDAVRQLLAAIPEGFPRPILVRLQLEGGRYDRLVRQMVRASALPVDVAEPGGQAVPGRVHFLPVDIGLRQSGAAWQFEADTPLSLDALPVDDCAVLVLSGADTRLLDAVLAPAWRDALVLGQTPDESCYDPAAANVVIAAGRPQGTPVELAGRLLDRWPPPGHVPTSSSSAGLLS